MINLVLDKRLFTEHALQYLTDYSHRWEFHYGGSGSGKSYSIAQKLIIRCCTEKIRVLVCRRYKITLRQTCFELLKEILNTWKITPYVKIRETDMFFEFPNGSEIILTGLDEETKLLSLQNISTVWIEEAYEVPRDIVEQLDLRLRGAATNQQIILSWNPINKHHWLYNFVEENPPANSIKYHTTFKDNPFLSPENVATLEDMKTRNPRKAEVYYYGRWGSDAEGLVITNWRVDTFDEMELAAAGLEHRAGLDFGWIDPTAAVDTLYDRENHIIYIFNEYYKSGAQLSEVAAAVKAMNLHKNKVYCDAAEPRSIQFLKTEGINALPCIKGKDSVKAGILFLQDNTIIVKPTCEKVIMELENFSYVKSKQTNEYTEQTTHEFSHSVDALRYAYSDIYTNTKLKSINKASLGL